MNLSKYIFDGAELVIDWIIIKFFIARLARRKYAKLVNANNANTSVSQLDMSAFDNIEEAIAA